MHHLMNIAHRPDAVMKHGRGSYLWDENGRRYLDWLQGWAVTNLGHAHAAVTTALQQQAASLLTPSPGLWNRPMLDAAAAWCGATGFDALCFTSSGAEANEAAVKLARKWGRLNGVGNGTICTLHGSFHGRTLAMMAASAKAGWADMYPPRVPGFVHAPGHDLDALADALTPDVTAVMLEPVQGEAGVIPFSDAYLQGVRSLCDEHSILLIADEIQTGVGRCGHLLLSEAVGMRADIVTIGKGLGNGVPIAAVLCREHVNVFEPGDQGGTYAGNPLVCAVALAVLQVMQQSDFLDNVRKTGEKMADTLGVFGPVRGRGLLLAVECPGDAGSIVERSRARGLLLNAPRPNVLRCMPSLLTTDEEIDSGCAVLGEVIHECVH